MDHAGLLRELKPTVERLMDRHLATTREWFPHELVPYGRGEDVSAGHVWRVENADLDGSTIDNAVRSSLIVNLLTEDNLPYYFRTIDRALGADGAWGAWSRRWTAEGGAALHGHLRLLDGDSCRRPGCA